MAKLRAFRAVRPGKSLEKKIAALPYDVVSFDEVVEIAGNNPCSFFHVTRAEMDLDPKTDPYTDEVYKKGRENLDKFVEEGSLVQDEKAALYLYSQVMNGQMQTGIVACASIDDYMNNIIKKHEFTREDKENDRTRHLDILDANTGPVFLIYRNDSEKSSLIAEAMKKDPVYDFEADDGIRHIVRVIEDESVISNLEKAFDGDDLYIADGHHRAASAVRVGNMRREANPSYTGEEEFNSFLSVIFPDDELRILAYNRVVKDLNGMNGESFITALDKDFTVEQNNMKIPASSGSFSMYLSGLWYTITPRHEISKDPVEALDVSIIQKRLLDPLLGIGDPRKDKRIDFVGGIRGTSELEKMVDSGKYQVAFSMYPTGVKELINVSDSGQVMPPKSTWFEPKLRSGLFVHKLG